MWCLIFILEKNNIKGDSMNRTDNYIRPRGYYDNQGNLLNVKFSSINDALSGVTASAVQINQLTNPIMFSHIGGLLIQTINKTGATSIYGTVVDVATGMDNAVSLSPASGQTPIGVMYSSSISNLATCWIVISGKADILLATGITASAGDWLGVSTVAGYASASNSPPVDARHDYEIGHCIKAASAGGLTRGIIHFR